MQAAIFSAIPDPKQQEEMRLAMGLGDEVLLGNIELNLIISIVEVRNDQEDFLYRPAGSKIFIDACPHMRPKSTQEFPVNDSIQSQLNNKREVRKHLPKITLNVDINKTLSPKTFEQYSTGRPITVVEASGTKRGSKFDLSLFCITGAGLDICSLKTTKLMGLKIH